MDTVIPPEVVEHLRAIAEKHESFDGYFTTRQLAAEMEISEAKARDMIRTLTRGGKVTRHRLALTDEQAHEMGYLSACGVVVYKYCN